MSYPKNQVVKFDTPKLGLGLFKKNYLRRFLELKERAGSSMSTVSRLCPAPLLQPLLRSIVTSIIASYSSSSRFLSLFFSTSMICTFSFNHCVCKHNENILFHSIIFVHKYFVHWSSPTLFDFMYVFILI